MELQDMYYNKSEYVETVCNNKTIPLLENIITFIIIQNMYLIMQFDISGIRK